MTENCLPPGRRQVVTEGGLNQWVGRRRGRESRGWKLSKINTGGRNISLFVSPLSDISNWSCHFEQRLVESPNWLLVLSPHDR